MVYAARAKAASHHAHDSPEPSVSVPQRHRALWHHTRRETVSRQTANGGMCGRCRLRIRPPTTSFPGFVVFHLGDYGACSYKSALIPEAGGWYRTVNRLRRGSGMGTGHVRQVMYMYVKYGINLLQNARLGDS